MAQLPAARVPNPQPTQALIAPQFTIRDIDEAVVKLFEKMFIDPRFDLIPAVRLTTGERWRLDREIAIKDQHGVVSLPMVSLNRGDLESASEQGMPGDADRLYVATTVEKRLSSEVRDFNVDAAAKHAFGTDELEVSNRTFDSRDAAYSYLVHRYVSTAFPKYVTIPYEFTFWCNTVTEANLMQELFLRSANLRKSFAINGIKGQTYSGEFEGTLSKGKSNTNDQGKDRKLIEVVGTITVNGYLTTQPQITTKVYPITATPSYSRVRWQTEVE